jgi:hypothetical protein
MTKASHGLAFFMPYPLSNNFPGTALAMTCVGAAAGCDLLIFVTEVKTAQIKDRSLRQLLQNATTQATESPMVGMANQPDHGRSTTARSIRR